MYHRILVPLDGSLFAEQALPLAMSIADRTGASLRLARVHVLYAFQDPNAARLPYDPALDAAGKQQEALYLNGVVERLAALAPVPVTADVVNGMTADAILEEARASKADLIVMTTHGRGPMSRFWLGSVADELLRRATVPILLIRPHEEVPELTRPPVLKHLLIPLDGTPLSERVLEPGLVLGRALEARYTLLRLITPWLFPGHDPTIDSPTGEGNGRLELQLLEASTYLEAVADRLRKQGCSVQTRVAIHRQPAAGILEEARKMGVDCIALATHGRGGLKRLLLGSVADKVLRSATLPLLVFHPAAE